MDPIELPLEELKKEFYAYRTIIKQYTGSDHEDLLKMAQNVMVQLEEEMAIRIDNGSFFKE